MAVYQGARRVPLQGPPSSAPGRARRATVPVRGGPVPAGSRAVLATIGRGAVATTRRRTVPKVRARRRASPVFLALSLIIVAFVLGLLYLTQSIRVAATSFEIDRLIGEQQRLVQQLQSLEGSITRSGGEPAIVDRAGQLGLDRLGGMIRLPAR